MNLIVTEGLNNTFNFAFPNERPGTITIRFQHDGGNFVLSVADDDVGFDPTTPPQGTGLVIG
ncbi:hypothetical protein TSH7_02795 [Azospirillum sp. TSH7]|nr:hypothetical protein TSH20_13455 [Azospirillum sp. TSH20]PWC68162.1 hypothetical protein TSH7_02795 [Azospirillum sp. TSH7]